MSRAVLALCGLADASQSVAADLLGALWQACTQKQPLERFILVVSSEVAFLTRRIELVAEYHAADLHRLASAVARQKTRRDDLLLLALDEGSPRFKKIALGPVRTAFVGIAETHKSRREGHADGN